MRLSEYASTRKTRGSYKMPRSVQQSIPIDRIYADGVWQSENVFSMMWQISDINYAMQSDAAKQNILTQLGTVYAGIPADCWMQVCIVSQRMRAFISGREIFLPSPWFISLVTSTRTDSKNAASMRISFSAREEHNDSACFNSRASFKKSSRSRSLSTPTIKFTAPLMALERSKLVPVINLE